MRVAHCAILVQIIFVFVGFQFAHLYSKKNPWTYSTRASLLRASLVSSQLLSLGIRIVWESVKYRLALTTPQGESRFARVDDLQACL